MSTSRRAPALFAALVFAFALWLPSAAIAPAAFADDADAGSASEESASEESAEEDGTDEEDASEEDEESSADEEGNELSTEGSANTGVTEYNAEGQEVTSEVTDDSDVRAAQIFLGVVAVLAAIGLVYLIQWLVRVYRPRRAVQRAAAEAAVTPVPADEPGAGAPPGDGAEGGKD